MLALTKTLWVHSTSEQDTSISADEFHIFNRCLDDAIAETVTSFGRARQVSIDDQVGILRQRVAVSTDEHQRLVGMAPQAYAAINTGNVGLRGSAGTSLFYPLGEVHSLAARTLPEAEAISAVVLP